MTTRCRIESQSTAYYKNFLINAIDRSVLPTTSIHSSNAYQTPITLETLINIFSHHSSIILKKASRPIHTKFVFPLRVESRDLDPQHFDVIPSYCQASR